MRVIIDLYKGLLLISYGPRLISNSSLLISIWFQLYFTRSVIASLKFPIDFLKFPADFPKDSY